MLERPFLLDVTRLISRGWTRRYSTGIDRVCYAYLDRFAPASQAVVQHRGVIRIMTPNHSDRLFHLLREPDENFRWKLAKLSAQAFIGGKARVDGVGSTYINVSHTDFDLSSHLRWVARCRLRSVYFLHDLIPIMHPQLCKPRAVERHRGRVRNALRTAAGIVVNSAATADELEWYARREKLPLPPLLVAPLGSESLWNSPPKLTNARPYFICVGTIEPRKNHAMLLRVWQNLIRQMGSDAPRLVIIGQWGVNAQDVRDALCDETLRKHVSVMSRVSDRELARWMADAQALLMPSLAEGYGLPVVEAISLGTPVIASDLPCFREIGQGVPALLDPKDAAAWEVAIRCFGRSEGERSRQLAAMRDFKPPVWADHFNAVASWIETLPTGEGSRQLALAGKARGSTGASYVESFAFGGE